MAVQLKAVVRENIHAKNLLRGGNVPVIVYGPDHENLKVQVLEGEIESLISKAKETTPVHITVNLDGGVEERNVFIKAVQFHKVTGKIIHVDLYEPDPKKHMKFKVPINFNGEAEGVKSGGTFDVLLRDIEVEALPSSIIEEMKIDISSMKIGESLRVKDLNIPENVRTLQNSEDVIAIIKAPRAEEEVTPSATVAETSEPEAIKTKGKKEEEEKEEK